jgi:hypothetical protein
MVVNQGAKNYTYCDEFVDNTYSIDDINILPDSTVGSSGEEKTRSRTNKATSKAQKGWLSKPDKEEPWLRNSKISRQQRNQIYTPTVNKGVGFPCSSTTILTGG